MRDSLGRIRRFAHGFDTAEDREQIAAAFKRYLLAADDGLTLEDAFELTSSARCEPWWRTEARAFRDMTLRELAKLFFPDDSLYVRAERIVAALERYASTRWPGEQFLIKPPARSTGTPEEIMWFALKHGNGELLSPRQLRRILAK
ncbi:hypothetical protein EHI44_24155 [Rhizobium leguminosarum]|nr:hypothetical protein EHI44_24155 [Rhizobium leguminosarum]